MDKRLEELKRIYKTHGKVAELLGIGPRQYARIRRGEYHIKKSMNFMIDELLSVNEKLKEVLK